MGVPSEQRRASEASTMPSASPESVIYRITQIGPYRLGKKLGEGAFAVVRIGRNLITDVQVACKIFDKAAIKDDYVRENLYREAEILRKQRHPNIIQLFEILETDDLYCLVMEMCEKDVLTHLCSVGVSSEVQARNYGRQLISAFEYLHANNIVHRDLKAENMMLDAHNRLKIIDFGLSNDMTDKDFLDTQCGSMAYSAPELLSSKPYGKAVDVWSIGVCLYVMLTGHLPFGNQNLTELHALMLDGSYELPDLMSDSLKDLFTRFFQVKPQKRITIAELWEHEWIRGDPAAPDAAIPLTSLAVTRELVDDMVVQQMVRMGVADAVEDVVPAVCANVCDRLSSTYHLLLLKRELLKARMARRSNSRSSLSRQGSNSNGSFNRRSRSGKLQPLVRRDSRNRDSVDSSVSPAGDDGPSPTRRGSFSDTLRRGEGGALLRRRHSNASLNALSQDGSSDSHLSSTWSVPRSKSLMHDDDGGDEGGLVFRSSRPGSRSSRSNSESYQQYNAYPPGLEYDSQSYSEVLQTLARTLKDSVHALDVEVMDEIVGTTMRALRLAPDTALLTVLREHGWHGVGFRDLASSAAALHVALRPLDPDVEEVMLLPSPPPSRGRSVSLVRDRDVFDTDGSNGSNGSGNGNGSSSSTMMMRPRRSSSFSANDRRPLPQIIRASHTSTSNGSGSSGGGGGGGSEGGKTRSLRRASSHNGLSLSLGTDRSSANGSRPPSRLSSDEPMPPSGGRRNSLSVPPRLSAGEMRSRGYSPSPEGFGSERSSPSPQAFDSGRHRTTRERSSSYSSKEMRRPIATRPHTTQYGFRA